MHHQRTDKNLFGLFLAQGNHGAADFIGMSGILQVRKHGSDRCAGGETEVEQSPARMTGAALRQRHNLRVGNALRLSRNRIP